MSTFFNGKPTGAYAQDLEKRNDRIRELVSRGKLDAAVAADLLAETGYVDIQQMFKSR